MKFPQVAKASVLALWLVCGAAGAAEPQAATPEQLKALYVGQWKLTCHWSNEVARLGARAGETMGGYEGQAQIVDREGQLILEITGEAPNGMRWDKELVMAPAAYKLTLDVKRNKRRAGITEYTRMDLVLSPDRTTLRGMAAWSNGLTANRSNEEQLLRALPPSGFYPWGVGFSSICLRRVESPPETDLSPPTPSEKPSLLLEAFDPDALAAPNELNAALDDLKEWLAGAGYYVMEKGASPVDFRGALEVARFQPNLSGQEFYLDTVSGQPVRFLKGTIPMGASFTIKDSKGKRTLLSVSLQRMRDSATPNEDPPTRVTPRGTVLLPPNMPQDLQRLLQLVLGQTAALPPKQKRSEFTSRLEELLNKGE
jgi:hypothetical protein